MNFNVIEEKLIKIMDMSRSMIDLAYYSLLYNDQSIAHEVLAMEEEVDRLHTDLELECLKAKDIDGDIHNILGVIRLSLCMESISDAAASIADVVMRGFKSHPILSMVFSETEEGVSLIRVGKGSEIDGKSLSELELDEMGINVLAVRSPGERWIKDPPEDFTLTGGILLLVSGFKDSIDKLRKMSYSPEELD
ncbi:MAG: PhoU domain-containing protein [Candidatus Methanomethylicia archaeon]